MADRWLYRTPLPEDSITSTDSQVRQQLSQLATLTGGSTAIPTGSQPGSYSLEANYRTRYAERLGTELQELLDADAVPYFSLYVDGADLPIEGYYAGELLNADRVAAQSDAAIQVRGTISKEGTPASHRRLVETPRDGIAQLTNSFGVSDVAYVGIDANASKVTWMDVDRTTIAAATPDSTVTTAAGDVDLYDVNDPPAGIGSAPRLLYHLPLVNEGDVDCAAFDDYGDSRFETEDGTQFATWQEVLAPDHIVRGTLHLENQRLRVVLDETATAAEDRFQVSRFNNSTGQFDDVALTEGDWQLRDVDLQRVGVARIDARVQFENTSNSDIYTLDMLMHRGWDNLQFDEVDSDSLPSSLETYLTPVASGRINSPQTAQTLIARSDIPV